MTSSGSEILVYWEKQVAGLCGVHCINTLLQGSIFTEVDLMHIARDLDERERQQMMAMGSSEEGFLRFMAEESGNVADDGNYSVQVLQEALKVWDVTLTPLASPEVTSTRERPELEEAFICHFEAHWFTIRKVRGHWINLNSLLERPTWLSPLYLSVFLRTLEAQQYTIFVARGLTSRVDALRGSGTESGRGQWLPVSIPESARSATQRRAVDDAEDPTSFLEADAELQSALEASLLSSASDPHPHPSPNRTTAPELDEGDDDDELAQAIALSTASPEDDELAAALALSMQAPTPASPHHHLPPEPPADVVAGVSRIAVRLPDGERVTRRFLDSTPLRVLYEFASLRGALPMDAFTLYAPPSERYALAEYGESTLLELGFVPSLCLTMRRN
mmetsp:Transcript_40523/g.101997  ORF Transcript_40523/g.101997 Transcript_40523/m.101997 type:complete len:391 (-) Transcript_40523:64-1236(-)